MKKRSLKNILKQLRYGEEWSCRQIADYLNQEGVPTPSDRGQWHATTVWRLLKKWRIP